MIRIIRTSLVVFLMILKNGFCGSDPGAVYLKYVNEIVNATVRDAKNEFGLTCDGSGGSMPMCVESIFISFISDKECTLEEARELEVKITEQFLIKINDHKKIAPFLKECPFKAEGAEIMISFRPKNCHDQNNSNVALVHQVKNTIFYHINEQSSSKLKLKLKEPYEEALKIVQSQSSST